jgi:hypothetical protein
MDNGSAPASPVGEVRVGGDDGEREGGACGRPRLFLSEMKSFDLNIEKVLEDWDISDALREIIANAIDEELLTNSNSVRIFKRPDGWHVRDFGRGLKYTHLTQNENEEKLGRRDLVIGKFGVGLKDALATLDRHRIRVHVTSRHGDISLGKRGKQGFGDVITLHALISDPSQPKFIGTDFRVSGVTKKQIQEAKNFFLRFSGEQLLEVTKYGQVLKRHKTHSRIYINGVKVAEEKDFLFSYNITSLTKSMERALNRERTHVGRAAYTERVKDILLECHNESVAEIIAKDLKNFEKGKLHDELQWVDVAVHACKLLNATDKYIFLTPGEYRMAPIIINRAQGDGYTIITIAENVRKKLRGLKDLLDMPIMDLSEYIEQWNTSFEFSFVKPSELKKKERQIYERTNEIFDLLGGRPPMIRKVLISETMRLAGLEEAVGVWEPYEERIVIKRSQLKSLRDYAGTLLHETAHATSGAPDVSAWFEGELTRTLGVIASETVNKARG